MSKIKIIHIYIWRNIYILLLYETCCYSRWPHVECLIDPKWCSDGREQEDTRYALVKTGHI